LQIDTDAIELFVRQSGAYGFWGLLAFVFIIWGLPHIPPIGTAVGTFLNDRHRTNLAHKRSMLKLQNKKNQNKDGKNEGGKAP